MPTAIATSTATTATAHANQRKTVRTSNGVLWAFFQDGNETYSSYSTDNGATWSAKTIVYGTADQGGVSKASVFIDVDDNLHLVWKQAHNATGLTAGYLYYRRATPNAGRTAWTYGSTHALTGSTAGDFPDLVAHREGTGWVVHFVFSLYDGASQDTVAYRRHSIASDGTVTFVTQDTLSSYGNAVHKYPSVDFNHTGDGKTVAGNTPHVYAAWSAGATGAGKGIRFKKWTYSSGSWTGGAEREIDSTRYVPAASAAWLNCLFDGTRVVIVGFLHDGTAVRDLVVHDRDAADTTTTSRNPLADVAAADQLHFGSASYDSAGNVYVVGANQDEAAGSKDLVWRKWTRSTATLGAETVIDATTGTPYAVLQRGYANSVIAVVYTDGTASPYTVTYDAIQLNRAPNAPTSLSPSGNVTVDRTITQRFSWTFSDPDSGDSQSKYDLQYRVVGAASWTTVTGTTPNQFHDFAAGTFAAGDYEWQVRTYDAAGVVGPWSSSAFFTAATPPSAPTITYPTNGGTISQSSDRVDWSYPTQQAYQVRKVADNAGSPDTATVYYDSGTVESTTARTHSLTFPTNNRYEHVQVRVRDGGLWSTWSSVRVLVSYTPPATPTLVAAGNDTLGYISIAVTNPAPAAGEPTVTSNDIRRRKVGESGDGTRIATGVAPSGSHNDYAAASTQAYEYQAVAYGDNGTSSESGWTA